MTTNYREILRLEILVWHRTQILIQSAKVNGNRETGCKWVHNKTVATSAGCKRASRTV